MTEIWFNHAVEALRKGDYDSAVNYLEISQHLNPTEHGRRLLNDINMKKQENFKEQIDMTTANQCIHQASTLVERKDYAAAKKILLQAHTSSFKARKMLEKVQNLEICQEKAYALFKKAQLEFEIGNLDRAEGLLKTAQKVHFERDAEIFLLRVRAAKENADNNNRNNNQHNRNGSNENDSLFNRLASLIYNVLCFFTCNVCTCCNGYTRLSSENSNHGGNSNGNVPNNQTPYAFSGNNIPNPRVRIHRYNDPHDARGPSGNRNANNNGRNTKNDNRNADNSARNTDHKNSEPKLTSPYAFRGENITNRRVRIDRNTNNEAGGPSGNRNANNNGRNTNNDGRNANNNCRNPKDNRNSNNNGRNTNNNGGNADNNCRNPYDNRNSNNNGRNTYNNGRNPDINGRNADINRNTNNNERQRQEIIQKEQIKLIKRILSAKDDYEILDLPKTANANDVRKAYRKLGLLLHPDKNKQPRAKEAFMAVGEAKERILKRLQ